MMQEEQKKNQKQDAEESEAPPIETVMRLRSSGPAKPIRFCVVGRLKLQLAQTVLLLLVLLLLLLLLLSLICRCEQCVSC